MRGGNAWLPRGRPGSWVLVAVSVLVIAAMYFARWAVESGGTEYETMPAITAIFFGGPRWFWPVVVGSIAAFAVGKDLIWKHPDAQYLINLLLLAGLVLLLVLNVFAFVVPVFASAEATVS